MALLSNLVDIVHASRAGDNLSGITMSTFNHSLNTNPDIVFTQMRSVQAVAAQANPALFWVGSNVSLSTIGFAVPSAASAPTVAYDIFTWFIWSAIR